MRAERDIAVVEIPELPAIGKGNGSLPAVEDAIRGLQQQMWEHAGLLRDAALLTSIDLAAAMAYVHAVPAARWTRREYEARSLARVARAIVVSALAREESRGAHYRNDFPQRDDVRFGTHSHLVDDSVSFGPLLPSDKAQAVQALR
jgi:L-aspartate oxidase